MICLKLVDRLFVYLKFLKRIGLPSCQFSKEQLISQKHANHAQLEALSLVEKDNKSVRCYFVKIETLVKQCWYNEYPSPLNPKFIEIFTRGIPKKFEDC